MPGRVTTCACPFTAKAAGNQTASAVDGTLSILDPAETSGPYPADGTNAKADHAANVLTQFGVMRQGTRAAFNAMTGSADGARLRLHITVPDVKSA